MYNVLDTELLQHGHRIPRLPPYHPDLDPIEKICALVKNWVAARNVTYKSEDVKKLAKQRFDDITPAYWTKICLHVEKIVNDA